MFGIGRSTTARNRAQKWREEEIWQKSKINQSAAFLDSHIEEDQVPWFQGLVRVWRPWTLNSRIQILFPIFYELRDTWYVKIWSAHILFQLINVLFFTTNIKTNHSICRRPWQRSDRAVWLAGRQLRATHMPANKLSITSLPSLPLAALSF